MSTTCWSLKPEDKPPFGAYVDVEGDILVGNRVGDIMYAGAVDSLAVSPRFVEASLGFSGVRFEPMVITRHSARPLRWSRLVVTGSVEYDHYCHARPEDVVPDLSGVLPASLGEIYCLANYRPAPEGAQTPDVFSNPHDGAVWISARARDRLAAARLENVTLRAASDFRPAFWGDELEDLRERLRHHL